MEIKLNAGDRFTIPANCKAIIEDDLIVIKRKKKEKQEEKQEEFKDGDILHSKKTNNIVIFKSYDEDNVSFCSYYNNSYVDNFKWGKHYFRHATEEEKQAFFDELEAKGLQWNAETKTMERIRKRAKKGGHYLGVDAYCGNILDFWEAGDNFDDEMFNSGNYYLPEERKQAEEDAKAIRAIFEKRLKVKL